jgi:hypothetical protein
MNRRTFITLAGGAALSTAFIFPFRIFSSDKRGGMEPFHWARLKFELTKDAPDKWNAHPWGDEFFLDRLQEYTNLNVDRTWYVAPLDNLDEMIKYPFIFMTAEEEFGFSELQRKNFAEYLNRGGFIFADDCVSPGGGDFFFADMKKKVEDLFGQKMVKLPDDHEIYRCFFKLNGLPHVQGKSHGGWALFLNGRMAVFLNAGDLHCGWCSFKLRKTNGKSWFTEEKELNSVKMGINILTYAITH